MKTESVFNDELKIYHVSGNVKKDFWCESYHSHAHAEIFVHVLGRMDLFIENKVYSHSGNEIRLYAPWELHFGKCDFDQDMEWYQISISDDFLKSALALLGADREAMGLVKSVPSISAEKTASFAKIMTICAEYMTLINALPGNKPSTAELTRLYVYENFREKITMREICNALGRTKSAICPAFKEKYGVSPGEYRKK